MQFFLVQVADKPGMLEKRMSLRPAHLEALQNKSAGNNFIICGGGVADKHPGAGETPQVTGSTLIVQTDDRDSIVEKLKGDVYAKEGVWDLTNVKIQAVSMSVQQGDCRGSLTVLWPSSAAAGTATSVVMVMVMFSDVLSLAAWLVRIWHCAVDPGRTLGW